MTQTQNGTKEYYESAKFRPRHVLGIDQFSVKWFAECDRAFVNAMRLAGYPEIKNFKRASGPKEIYDDN